MDLKYRYPATFNNLKVIKLIKIDQKDGVFKVQIICVGEIAFGSGKKTKLKSSDFSKEAEAFWKAKISREDWEHLRSKGLAKGAIIDIYAAVDSWSSRNDSGSISGGTWYQILKVTSLNYQPCDYSLIQALEPFEDNDSLDSLESEINTELGEFDAA